MNAVTKLKPDAPATGDTLAGALAAAFAEIEGATKSAANPHFKSKYADLTAVIEAIKPALIAHDLFFTQRPQPSEGGVSIETVIGHANGEELSLGTLFVPANKNDAQGFGSALTYARRYALVTAFGVPVEDDDGNAAARSSQTTRPVTQTPAKAPPAHSKLKTELRALVHDMEGCGDWDTWVGLREDKNTQRLIHEVQEKLPQWWSGGEDMPEEFVPLERRIEILEFNLAEDKADRVAEHIQAG